MSTRTLISQITGYCFCFKSTLPSPGKHSYQFKNGFGRTIIILLAQVSFICACKEATQEKDVNPLNVFELVEEGRIAFDSSISRGVAWADFDADGDTDLFVANANGQWNYLYKNLGSGTFQKMTDSHTSPFAISASVGGHSQGVNWIDFDNDGDLDLYINNRGEAPNFLFENKDFQKFVQIIDNPLVREGLSSSMACWGDIDNDGDLDVLVIGYSSSNNYLFENTGPGTFRERQNHPLIGQDGRGRACACGDVNNDFLPDFYIANARRPNQFFINKGDWEFETIQEGHLVTDVGYSYGVSFADIEDDGDMDLFVANFDKENFLYINDGHGTLKPHKTGVIAIEKGGASKGHAWGDYDNDGDLDLIVANGTYGPAMRNFLYWNNGKNEFEEDTMELLTKHADTSAGLAWSDYDNDGDLDVFVANWGGGGQVNRLYKNNTMGRNWVAIRLKGIMSNSFGLGSKVTISSSENGVSKKQYRWMFPITGYGSQNDYLIHFGLGDAHMIDSLKINWPSGEVDVHTDIKANKYWIFTEGKVKQN